MQMLSTLHCRIAYHEPSERHARPSGYTLDDFRRFDRQIAVVRYQGNRRRVTTYGELARLAGRFAALLAQRGIGPGDRVLLWAENSAEWMAAFYGCMLRGVLAVPLDAIRNRRFCRAGLRRCAAQAGRRRRSAAAPAARRTRPTRSGFEDWLAASAAEEAGAGGGALARNPAANSLHLRHHRRSQGHRPYPWQRAGQRGAHRRRRAALYALRAARPSSAHSAHAAAEPCLRADDGAVDSSHLRRRAALREPAGGAAADRDHPPRAHLRAGRRAARAGAAQDAS